MAVVKSVAVTQLLLRHLDVNMENDDGSTALQCACVLDNIAESELLLCFDDKKGIKYTALSKRW